MDCWSGLELSEEYEYDGDSTGISTFSTCFALGKAILMRGGGVLYATGIAFADDDAGSLGACALRVVDMNSGSVDIGDAEYEYGMVAAVSSLSFEVAESLRSTCADAFATGTGGAPSFPA